jgi:hypothetical protein
VEVATAPFFHVARRSDGGITQWGSGSTYPAPVPTLPAGVTCTRVAAGPGYAGAVLSDGTVRVWGNGGSGLQGVPSLPAGLRYEQLALGPTHAVARRSDGSVVVWGSTAVGLQNVPTLPAGVQFLDVAAGNQSVYARLSNETTIGWGAALQIPAPTPGGNYKSLAAGDTSVIVGPQAFGYIVSQQPYGGPVTFPTSTLINYQYTDVAAGYHQVIGVRFTTGEVSYLADAGSGCVGTLPTSRIIGLDYVRIGAELRGLITNLPLGIAFLVGGSNVAVTDLAVLGMPGCTLWNTGEVIEPVPGTGTTALWRTSFPSDPALVGAMIFLQAMVPDPGVNAFGATMSDAVSLYLGW